MNKKFRGTGVAVITPFHRHGTVDFNSLGKVVNHLVDNKVDYLVILGTTAETATLSKDEKVAVVNFVKENVNKRLPIVLGVGGNNTQDVINCLKSLDTTGLDAILSVSPYYNKPRQKGIYLHYKSIAAASPLPIILYNVPGRTSSNITAETTLALAHDFSNIIGIKEASGNLAQSMEIIKNKPEHFHVISGDDILTLPLLSCGADGVISVVANAFPAEFSQMVRYGLKGDFNKARELHYRLTEIIDLLFVDGNPAGVKAAMSILGLVGNNLRLPLVKARKQTNLLLREKIKMHLNESKL